MSNTYTSSQVLFSEPGEYEIIIPDYIAEFSDIYCIPIDGAGLEGERFNPRVVRVASCAEETNFLIIVNPDIPCYSFKLVVCL
jgi:hypothetical protein